MHHKEKIVYRFLGVIDFSDTQILQWNNSSGFFILGNKRDEENTSSVLLKPSYSIYLFSYKSQAAITYSRVLKVVEAVICENEPASLPGLNSPS